MLASTQRSDITGHCLSVARTWMNGHSVDELTASAKTTNLGSLRFVCCTVAAYALGVHAQRTPLPDALPADISSEFGASKVGFSAKAARKE